MLINPRGTAYLGIKDFKDPIDILNGIGITIDFYWRHHKTYLGDGAYGTYGGIDITLLHLKTSADSVYPPACLPRMAFQDTDRKANIAGYGQYKRDSCQTDEFGPSKYHYCNSTCVTNQNPPQNALCEEFFKNSASKDLGNLQDIILLSGSEITYCFRNESPKPGSDGWCHVTIDALNLNKLQETESWGFCGKDCKQDDEPEMMVLRKVEDIDILPEKLCNMFLQNSFSKGEAKVEPQILCIGIIDRIDIKVFKVRRNGRKEKDSSQIHHISEIYHGKLFFI